MFMFLGVYGFIGAVVCLGLYLDTHPVERWNVPIMFTFFAWPYLAYCYLKERFNAD